MTKHHLALGIYQKKLLKKFINYKNETQNHINSNYLSKNPQVLQFVDFLCFKTKDFIEYEGAGVAIEGISFAEEMGGIHSIVNNKSTLSVSLHIYKTNQLNLSGVRIFDLEHKKWAVLNDKAPSCTWNLPEEAFEKIYQL